jgi:hypothetical protein
MVVPELVSDELGGPLSPQPCIAAMLPKAIATIHLTWRIAARSVKALLPSLIMSSLLTGSDLVSRFRGCAGIQPLPGRLESDAAGYSSEGTGEPEIVPVPAGAMVDSNPSADACMQRYARHQHHAPA